MVFMGYRFLRGYIIEEDDLNYIQLLDTCLKYVTQIWGLNIAHGIVLTLLKHYDWHNKITSCMYGL